MSEPVGSAAEEAARLLAAAEHWVRDRAGAASSRTGWHLSDEHLATGSAECTVCPLCQGVSALRQVRPEAVGHLLDAASSLVAALRAAVPVPEPPTPGSRVQHIVVEDGPDAGPGQGSGSSWR